MNTQETITQICQKFNNDRARLMDIVIAVQKKLGCVSSEAMEAIASAVKAHRVEVEGVVSFYAFLSKENKGNVIIRLCNDVVDNMQGLKEVAKAFSNELGIGFGETTSDGKITLEYTPCIGMCDQAPAALINETIFPSLTAAKVKDFVQGLKDQGDPAKISQDHGDGNNDLDVIGSAVNNNIQKTGRVIFDVRDKDSGLKKAIVRAPEDVIAEVKGSKVRGRGGAGFPTGMKWEFTRASKNDQKYVLCNADEGEPGTFKDRVILTEEPDLVFEGMTIAGYAVGSDTGVLYLRGEYAYLRKFLEKVLSDRREKGLLGKDILGHKDFNFDIRIQSGAGAYICGEESAMISSCEGSRGDPKTRPPFPPQSGFLAKPTTVNNVETFCCVSRILEKGGTWFAGIGTDSSTGTKLLSVSGDCDKQGVFEFPFGITIQELLDAAGAKDTMAFLLGCP